jgi:hypothetical protein
MSGAGDYWIPLCGYDASRREHLFGFDGNARAVIASEAKQSMVPLVAAWIASSLRSSQ